MQLGMVGLGRMGANMVRRAARAGHECVVFDARPEVVTELAQGERSAEGGRREQGNVTGASSLADLVAKLRAPRFVWIMLPVAVVDATIGELTGLLAAGDTVIDGGNTHYHADLRRAGELSARGLHYVDVGTSGGVLGLERGYCMMIGGEPDTVRALEPLFESLAPGFESAPRTAGRQGDPDSAERGYLHCGPAGAGHFVKMVHNGIEYGLMAAYAEGFSLLRHANAGKKTRAKDAETTPLAHPEHFQYEFDLPAIAELWRRGSVIPSWLLDLTARELQASPDLASFRGKVSDSGEGRWTIQAAIEEGVPVHVLSAALFDRFASRGEGDFANKVLSAMRHAFGGHAER